jgi:hypothetical protein
MSSDRSRLGSFEERLLQELRSVVIVQPTPRRPRIRMSFSRRRLALAGGVAALAAVAAAAGVPFLTGGAEPAYAVSKNDDGSVTVEVGSLADAAGLEAKLREAGIPAVVQYLPPGKACKQPWFTRASPGDAGAPTMIKGGVLHTTDGRTRFTISKGLPADLTLVIMTQTGTAPGTPTGAASMGIAFAKGTVPPCEMVDVPAGSLPLGPPPPGAQLHTNVGTAGSAVTS